VGSLLCEESVLRAQGGRRVSPFLLPMFLPDAVPGTVAITHGLKGPNLAHLSACASGANAIGEAFEAIRRGVADVMVAGGAEAAIVPVIVAGFHNMGALSKWTGEPTLASRPFDRERDGFVVGEGAAVLVLERLSHALARGASIRAELVGYGVTADAVHVTAPAEDGEGMVRAARMALAEARLAPTDIAYVNAHGTSTPLNDAVETLVLKQLFGSAAYNVPVSSIKSMIGHLLGAGGAVEAMAAVSTIQTGIIPPTINLNTPDPACDLDYVPHRARHVPGGVPVVMSNSLGFGGHNAALIFQRYS
jgi:3-oxoacyl-[acyl-carrier-protein] synthase II